MFTICPVPSSSHEDERIYAFFNSYDFETITGRKMSQGGPIKRYICISNKCKRVYKQYCALNGVNKKTIALDYESKCTLGVKDGDEVKVCQISKLCYGWHTSDSLAKISFIIAIISFIIAIYTLK